MKRCFYIEQKNGTDLLRVEPSYIVFPPTSGLTQLSWAKWDWLVAWIARQNKNYRQEVADGGGSTCALCVANYQNCPACPVHKHTGRYGCHGTPYDDWRTDPSLTNATAMRDFMWGIHLVGG